MRFAFLLLVPFLALLAACGSGDAGEPDGTPTPRPTPSDATAIRGVDLASAAATEDLLQRLGSGRAATEAVVYTDLTGDEREEAIVPITSDGTLGNLAYLVYTMKSGSVTPILTRTMDRSTASGLVIDVEADGIVETVGVYGPEDPFCCPTEMRYTTFRWDGTVLRVEKEETEKLTSGTKH